MRLITNRPEFYNDICEEIRLFIPRGEISLDSEQDGESTLSLLFSHNEDFTAEAVYEHEGKSCRYVHKTPARFENDVVEKRYAKRCMKTACFRALRQAYPDKLIPWGSLTGIRPTRLLRELTETEGRDAALRMMRDEFDVTEPKILLADEINSVQLPYLRSAGESDLGVYVGIPFCRTRCLYCSFASRLRTKKTDMAAYLRALHRDIELGSEMARSHRLSPRSFYVGGGTPTILTEDELGALLDKICSCYDTAGREFTVEAGRPDTITKEKLLIMKAHGVNRVSVNPQTMCDRTLKTVGRDHTSDDIIACFEMVKDVGFDSVNMDLIAGLPNESIDDFASTLNAVGKLDPDCLTVHTLAIKRASRLHEHMDEYELPSVDEVDRMVDLGLSAARGMGMSPYYMYRQKYMAGNLENVGYSKPGSVCVYNIDMMEDGMSILAHGAGAMTKRVFDGGGRIERVPNNKDIETYTAKIEETNAEREKLFNL